MDAFWVNNSSFLVCGTKLARNQQKIDHNFWSFFKFSAFYGQKMQEKVSKSWNADKNGLGKYLFNDN